jgi:nucleoside diphosphate kinase
MPSSQGPGSAVVLGRPGGLKMTATDVHHKSVYRKAPTTDVPRETLCSLTKSEEKRIAYSVDPYFRHGVRRMPVAAALTTTFVVLKPDAIAGRRAMTVVNELAGRGFSFIDASPFTFTPSLIRELWRYQYNVASWERIEIVDLMLPSSESLLLIVRDEQWEPGGLPAACRLAALKGPADPAKRKPTDLRSALNSPTPQFNFVHTADEPADVVRELAAMEVAFGWRTLGADTDDVLEQDAVKNLVERLYGRLPAHDLDRNASWRRIAASGSTAASSFALQALNGEEVDCTALFSMLADRKPPAQLLWDVLSIATAELPHSLPEPQPVIPTYGADASAWRGRR